MDAGDYITVSSEAVAVSKILGDMYIRLGRPQSPLTKQGEKLMNILIATWEDLMPSEAKRWHAVRVDYQKAEMTIKEQVKKHTGRSLASYPMYIYKIMKKLFPEFNPTERSNCMKMVKKWPMFRLCNRI